MRKTRMIIKNRLAEHLAIKERQEGRSISHRDLVEETGIAKSTIGSYMRNEPTRYENRVVAVLCEYLEIEPKDFFTWIEVSEESDLDTEDKTLLAVPA